jgi:hypothetical protein
MKNTFLTSALVAIVGLALVGAPITAKAQTNAPATTAPTDTTTPKAKKKSGKIQYEGSITAIDASSLTVATTKKTLTLAIAPTTKFAIKGKKDKTPATVADFAVGDKVTGSYTVDATGAMTAASVHKKAVAAATATPAATTPAAPTAPATTPTTPAAQ